MGQNNEATKASSCAGCMGTRGKLFGPWTVNGERGAWHMRCFNKAARDAEKVSAKFGVRS